MATVALVGNPNSGKTTLFNALTGASQFVGNWPGVTVERKEGKFKINKEQYTLVDLPGIYSLSPYSQEEVIARDYILNQKPDLVVNIVDASNLERNLYLTTQVIELGVPTVVALNMCDVVKKKGEKIDASFLAKQLGCPVIEISAVKKHGIKELKKAIQDVSEKKLTMNESSFRYDEKIQAVLDTLHQRYKETFEDMNNYGALKILCNDEHYLESHVLTENDLDKTKIYRNELEEKYDDDIDSIIAEQRYQWIASIIDKVIVQKRKEKLSLSDKIDKVITNRWAALPIFLAVIYLVYFLCLHPQGLGKWLVARCFDGLIWVMINMTTFLTSCGVSAWLVDLVVNGIIFGVGIVIAFVPYLMLLFFFLALLEECGYMSRVAFIMDRLFRRFGLSGKSFIPMLLGTGCTVQAIASVRTIENENDRKMTIFLAPFMPCATKMPVILLVIGILTNSAWMAPLIYVLAIIFIICAGLFLKHTKFKGDPTPFVMELPEYKIPTVGNVCHYVWAKTVSFFKKASTIILVSSVVIWFLMYFTPTFQHAAATLEDSILAVVCTWLEPFFAPIGLDNWRLIASMLTGYVAKDKVLSTIAQLFALDAQNLEALQEAFRNNLFANNSQLVSFLSFFLLSSPCFASMGAMSKELGSRKLTAEAIGFQMGSAYLVSMVLYNVLRIFSI